MTAAVHAADLVISPTEPMLTPVPGLRCPQESFDPIVDMSNGEDLLPKMVYADGSGDYDFQGMHAILLRYRCATALPCTPSATRPCH